MSFYLMPTTGKKWAQGWRSPPERLVNGDYLVDLDFSNFVRTTLTLKAPSGEPSSTPGVRIDHGEEYDFIPVSSLGQVEFWSPRDAPVKVRALIPNQDQTVPSGFRFDSELLPVPKPGVHYDLELSQ